MTCCPHLLNQTIETDVGDDYLPKTLVSINFYIVGIGGFIMFFLGIITNALNLVILTRKSMKTTTNKYLASLAICDIFVLVFSTIITSNSLINDYELIEAKAMERVNPDFLRDLISGVNYTNDDLISGQSNRDESFSNAFDPTTIHHLIFTKFRSLYFHWVFKLYPYVYPFAYPLAIMFQVATVWINLGMSIDRFIAIHCPLKSLKYCTIRNAKKIIYLVFGFSFFYSLPRFLEYHTNVHTLEYTDFINNHTLTTDTTEIITAETTPIGKSSIFIYLVYFWMYLLFHSVLPLIILTFLNFALIFSLRKSYKFKAKFNETNLKQKNTRKSATTINSSNSGRQSIVSTSTITPITQRAQARAFRTLHKERNRKEITIMLITLLLIFIILHTPSLVCNFLHGFDYTFRVTSVKMSLVCSIGNFLIMTNSATNFFAYMIFNKPFRRELFYCCVGLLRCEWKTRDRMDLTIHNAQVHRVTEWRRKSTLDDNRIKIANLRESNETEREEVIKDTLNNNIILNEEYVDFGKDASPADYV